MKKVACLMILAVMTVGTVLYGHGETQRFSRIPRVILFTAYRQAGWGDRVQVGCIDEKGGVWMLEGYDSDLSWPYQPEAQLDYLQNSEKTVYVGGMEEDDLFDLKSLIASVQDQGHESQPAACDAGTESSYAVRYGRDGETECILLGMSGDEYFENTDPNAQTLYLLLRRIFSGVTCYVGSMGPAGFVPVPVRTFSGMEGIDFGAVTVSAYESDCETGIRELPLSEKERDSILNVLLHGYVTGKENALAVTGGTVSYVFRDAEENFLASVEFYKGLLVRTDGMYAVTTGLMEE